MREVVEILAAVLLVIGPLFVVAYFWDRYTHPEDYRPRGADDAAE